MRRPNNAFAVERKSARPLKSYDGMIMIKTSYTTKHCCVDDNISLTLRLPEVMSLLDDTVTSLCHILALDLPNIRNIPVIFRELGNSEVVKDGAITVVPREDSRCGLRDWFELLFRHETTHWLVRRAWGQSCVMFWEGLPVYLADNVVRQRVFQFSYHDYCAALLGHQALLALSTGLLPHQYYGMSHDFRMTAEYGSFTGFLVERYGMSSIQKAYQMYIPPTPQHPILELSPLFQAIWGKDLQTLEVEWQTFLTDSAYVSGDAEALVAKRHYSKQVALKDRHCRFCYAPYGGGDICPVCHASQNIEITIT
jgi:hypothetical protein